VTGAGADPAETPGPEPTLELLLRLDRRVPAPRRGGEVAYDEPWQARLVALTAQSLDTAAADRFAGELETELRERHVDPAEAPAQAYWSAWLEVFERVAG
jgi:hypothetical protein